jgi:16S rRNA (adenine1518-N6/adenine1519-N6)-dimethyltransferase
MADKKLYSPNTIKDIMARHGFKFSKKLGQNFLIDGNIISSVCENSEIS